MTSRRHPAPRPPQAPAGGAGDDGTPWGGAALGWAAVMLPAALVLLSPSLPMQDLPNHMAIVDALLRREHAAGWGEHLTARLGIGPYALWYGAHLLLARVLGVSAAAKLLLAVYAASLPALFRWVLRASGNVAGAWAGLLAVGFVFSDAYLLGFTSFLAAIPLWLVGLGCAMGLARAGGRPAGWAAGLVATQGALYLAHPLGLAALLVAAPAAAATGAARGRRLAGVAATLLPGAALLGWYAVSQLPSGAPPVRLGAAFSARYLATVPLAFPDALSPVAWGAGLALWAWLAAVAGGSLAAARRSGWRAALRGSFLPAALLLGAAAWAAPFGLGATIWLGPRLMLLAVMLLALEVARWTAGRTAARAPVALLAALSLGSAAWGHVTLSAEMQPLRRLVRRLPDSRRMVMIAFDPSAGGLHPFYSRQGIIRWFSPFAHGAGYYHLEHGGTSPFLAFGRALPWIPVALEDPAYAGFSITDPFEPERLAARTLRAAPAIPLLIARDAPGGWDRAFRGRGARIDREGPFAAYWLGDGGTAAPGEGGSSR